MLVWGKHEPKFTFYVKIELSHFLEQVLKQAVGEAERKSQIIAILNKYKDTLDDIIDRLDTKFSDPPKSLVLPTPIDQGICNEPRSRSSLPTLFEEDCKDKNVSIMSFELAPKISNF